MRKLLMLTAALVPLALAPGANGQDPEARQTAKLRFTSERPGSPTGIVLRIDYVNPDDPSAKPPAVRRVVIRLARGASFDTTAPERCPASDFELIVLGTSACPPGSLVGAGRITLDTGLPEPARFLDVNVDFFNNTNELIYLNQATALDIPRVVLRSPMTDREIVTEAPLLPGTPPDGAAIDTVFTRDFVTVRRVDGERRSYVTTPDSCPPRGHWVNRVEFTYGDGVIQTVRSRSRCESEG